MNKQEGLINMIREKPSKKLKKGTREQKRKIKYPKKGLSNRVKIIHMKKKGKIRFSK